MNTSRPRSLHRIVVAASMIVAEFPQIGWAQTPPRPPSAGSILREVTPPLPRPPETAPTLPVAPAVPDAAPRPAGPSFTLRSIRFVGATVFGDAELQGIAAPRIGTAVTLADVEAIAEMVTERYRERGYLLAQAVVPIQDVTSGNLDISVLEGRIGRVRLEVDPTAPIEESRVRAYTSRIVPGQPLLQATLERVMLLLADLPGISVEASLESGETSGSTDLSIVIRPDRRWDLSFDADNYGTRSTSEYRVGVQGRWKSPLRVGDNIDYRLQLGEHADLAFGRIGYERPVGGDGVRIGLAVSRLEYALGKEFAALDATGNANEIDVALTYPAIRSRSRNVFFKAALAQKLLEDRFGAVSVVNDKRIRGLSIGLNAENSDQLLGGGYTSFGLTMFSGQLNLNSEAQRAADAAFLRTAGGFTHLNYSLSRLNSLTANVTVFVGVSGQVSDKNLDSAEKISLGGPRGVRAYAPSEATADEGQVVNAELRFSPTREVSLQAFYDWGRAWLHHTPLPLDLSNKIILRGAGVGIYAGLQSGFLLSASLAWRGKERGTADSSDRVPRLYVQVAKVL